MCCVVNLALVPRPLYFTAVNAGKAWGKAVQELCHLPFIEFSSFFSSSTSDSFLRQFSLAREISLFAFSISCSFSCISFAKSLSFFCPMWCKSDTLSLRRAISLFLTEYSENKCKRKLRIGSEWHVLKNRTLINNSVALFTDIG